MTVEIVDVSTGRVEVIEIDPGQLAAIEVTGATSGARDLDDLLDVDGAEAGTTGQVLTKQSDGQYRPATLAGGGGTVGPLAYTHDQTEPSTVWLIDHGLPFLPAGIDVRDHLGNTHYPVTEWPAANTVRLNFTDSVRGTARLS